MRNILAPLPPQTVAEARMQQIKILQTASAAATASDVAYMDTTFQADAASRSTLSSTILALAGSAVPAGFYWLDSANTQVPMTAEQLQGLASAMFAQGWGAFLRLQARKADVLAATSIEAVQAVIW